MQLTNEFTVDAPLADAWSALTDIPRMASCIPGAEIDAVDGSNYDGHVAVKVGPVGLTLQGSAVLVNQDDAAHTMVVRGAARDRTGQGSAEATISITARDDAGRTVVVVTTDLDLGGRIAQFGSGVISQVSGRIIKQFVSRLNTMISTGDAPAADRTVGLPTSRTGAAAVHRDVLVQVAATALAGIALGLAVGRAVYAR
ncbi:carbon monoxide dehydrogenase subunit G [Mycolicibacterium murale]|jgi:carbon monoxide dehydrogenase subunit G|uniref:Carbon monoxide dehydrogenase subunit G n=1 Tax=Mycolicibacterium murale TaxID=182220 RepID=A0A7I9WW36_9MYCO|nr:SRPBCC family protein [Mycolicibacterium murale]MCV7180933.1 SRPBCC family protein [Mycolicibacterium murale]GFG61905.1 carbon monoxide dehydrogenase subunit G [Mycolicibacterium murale]